MVDRRLRAAARRNYTEERRSATTRFRARLVALVVLAAALPLAATAWAIGDALADNEVERADASLKATAHSAETAFAMELEDAQRRANTLASSRRIQRALARRDRAVLRRHTGRYPPVVFYAGGTRLAGRDDAFSPRHTARVIARGRTLGRVVALVPLDERTFRRLREQGVVQSDGDRLRLGRRLDVPAGEPTDVQMRGVEYRAVAAEVVSDRAAPQIVVLRPRERIDSAADDVWRDVVLAALATLAALALFAFLLAPAVARGRLAQQQRAQAVRVLSHVGDGVFLVDRGGVVRFWNAAAEAITGLAAASVVGRPADEAIPGWRSVAGRIPVATSPGGGERARAQTVPLDVAGDERWLSISAVEFADGRVYAFRDLTEERRVEELKTGFVATVSHELRTPLASIYGASKTLQEQHDRLPESARRQLVALVAEQSEHLARLVGEIILASQLDAGTIRLAEESFDAEELARGVVESARERLPEGLSIDLEAGDPLTPVAGDTDKARQVLAALIENAANYSPGGGRITVGLAQQDGHVRFSVHDQGLGIPATEQERIFEKFYRLDPNMRGGVGGVGLGLYIARELVHHMHGRIWVASQPGGGSTFSFELPAAAEAAPPDERTGNSLKRSDSYRF